MRTEIDELIGATGLDPAAVERVIRLALGDDLSGGADVTTQAAVPADHEGVGEVTAREPGVVAGIAVAAAVFDRFLEGKGAIVPGVKDGATVAPGAVVLTVAGPTRALLTAERSALNLLCHLSGIATLTRRWADAVSGTGAVIRDTRKTTPGLRVLEKYAVRCGGGQNHRMSLTDQALIKDNHVRAAGGVRAALAAVRAEHPEIVCEVECDTLPQVEEAVAGGARLVLLDNMSVDQLRKAVELARPHGVRTEASGGITLGHADEIARTGVDYLAIGALTHSAPTLDFGLDLR